MEKKIIELKAVAKDSYEGIWKNIMRDVYDDVEREVEREIAEYGVVKRIFRKIRSPNSADMT